MKDQGLLQEAKVLQVSTIKSLALALEVGLLRVRGVVGEEEEIGRRQEEEEEVVEELLVCLLDCRARSGQQIDKKTLWETRPSHFLWMGECNLD